MNNTITITHATLRELTGVTALFNDYRIFYGKPSEPEAVTTFLEERLTKNDSVIFISLQDDVIIGFIQLYPLLSSTRMKKLWLLNDLFVAEQFRGQGLSRVLLDRAKQHCRETGSCGFVLETAKANHVANLLYHKEGLTRDNDHNYYTWDID